MSLMTANVSLVVVVLVIVELLLLLLMVVELLLMLMMLMLILSIGCLIGWRRAAMHTGRTIQLPELDAPILEPDLDLGLGQIEGLGQ